MSGVEWENLAEAGKLGTRRPEEIVSACRQMGNPLGDRLRDKLLLHLRNVGRSYLLRRANRNMPNGGLDAVEDVLSGMWMAIADSAARDGAGYEAAFHKKLEQRLADRHRTWRRDLARLEPFSTDEETDETLEPADHNSLTPEEIVAAGSLIAGLPDKLRRVFLLNRAGYPMASQGVSISSMLKVTPKTADKWLREANALLLEQMGRAQ